MESNKKQLNQYSNVKFYITGFGPFGNILKNPTSVVLGELTEEELEENNILNRQILEVSTIAVQNYFNNVCPEIIKYKSTVKNSQIIFVHFGVYSGSECFNIEEIGYNCADFRIPDMRNYQCSKETIIKDYDLSHNIHTNLPIKSICEQLQQNKFKCQLSNDPGRYLCNYIYFYSLHHTHQLLDTSSLFIHVPEFQQIEQIEQKRFILSLLKSIHSHYINKEEF